MDIYDDYLSFMKENKALLDNLQNNNTLTYSLFDGAIKVMEYLCTKAKDGAKLSEEELDVFDIGFGYITNSIQEVAHYIEDYFNNNFDTFKNFDNLLFYYFYLEDVKGYLHANDELLDEYENEINNCEDLIFDSFKAKDLLTDELSARLENACVSCLPPDNNFTPTYAVFNEIVLTLL